MSVTAALVGVPAAMASGPTPARVVAHFDLAAGQTPENAVIEPDGSTDVTFAEANQVAHVTRDGKVTVLAQLPPGGKCVFFAGPGTLGIARAHDGTLYAAECSGTSTTGIWRVRAGSLSTPTSVRVLGNNMYVTSAAYFTAADPNLLVAHLAR